MQIEVKIEDALPKVQEGTVRQGTAVSPDGKTIGVNSLYFTYDGSSVLPVMGEFHYSRFLPQFWEESICKLKACHVDILSSYVIWIHHEEVKGEWDFSGCRDLRRFLLLCQKHGRKAILRVGPWAHAEVRNGGFPDWLLEELPAEALRSNDTRYLGYVKAFYQKIAEQVQGLLWKDGGPVIALQLENEYPGESAHLKTLKEIAEEAGFDTPFDTATAWGCNGYSDIPDGEMIPAFGGYPDAPWAGHIHRLHRKEQYVFTKVKNDAIIGSDLNKNRQASGALDTSRYPYMTCELGTGVQPTRHRRPCISTDDMLSLAYTKLGSGLNLIGYYMFHGGTNPDGKRSTLQESTATGYPNDLPVKNYDFQAPIGEYGVVREAYHHYRLLHLFLQEFGGRLADTKTVIDGEQEPLRHSVRIHGNSGFLFVNNYQRYTPMPQVDGVQFTLQLAQETLCFPLQPFSVPQDCYFVLPFHFDLDGVDLAYATAQPICRIQNEGETVYFFFAPEGIAPEYALERAAHLSEVGFSQGNIQIVRPQVGKEYGFQVEKNGKTITVVTLSKQEALAFHKVCQGGREEAVLCTCPLLMDGETVLVQPLHSQLGDGLFVYGAPKRGEGMQHLGTCGRWDRYGFVPDTLIAAGVQIQKKTACGEYEVFVDWTQLEQVKDIIVTVQYEGSRATLYAGGELVADQYYCDGIWKLSLRYLAEKLRGKKITLNIEPLSQGDFVFVESFPPVDGQGKAQRVIGVHAQCEYQFCLTRGGHS